MKKIIPFLLFLICFSTICKGQVNFTASLGDEDKKIKFHIHKPSAKLKAETKYLWSFGDGSTSTEQEPLHQYKKAGNYTVCLKIDNKDSVCKENVFTVTETGLKVKYVNDENIMWPSGDVSKIDSPFSFRIKANGVTYDYHRALDIVGDPGDDVKAVADGVVHKSYGFAVALKHKMDTPMYFRGKVTDVYYSRSIHLDERYVEEGEKVKKGEVIAAVGTVGSKNYPHNHFEIMIGSYYTRKYLDKSKNSSKRNTKTNYDKQRDENIDPHVNPFLFLNNATNENNSLKYSIFRDEKNLYVKVHSDYLEDNFNEIELKHSSGTSEEKTVKLNFNTREGLPYIPKKISGDESNRGSNYDYDYQDPNDKFDIFPIKFKYRKGKNYQIIFSFYDVNFDESKGDYLFVRDIYGNKGEKVNSGLIVSEANFKNKPNKDYNFDGEINEDDHFIEIVNYSKKVIDMSQYKIFDNNLYQKSNYKNSLFKFSKGTKLLPGQVLLLFKNISSESINEHYKLSNSLLTLSANKDQDFDINEDTKVLMLANKYNGVLDIVSDIWLQSKDNTIERSPNIQGDLTKKKTKATPGIYSIN